MRCALGRWPWGVGTNRGHSLAWELKQVGLELNRTKVVINQLTH